MTREQADNHFGGAGIHLRGGAGVPGSPGQIVTYGHLGGRGFSITSFCSLQFANDDRATGIEQHKITSLTIMGSQLVQWTGTTAVAGRIDRSAYTWASQD